LREIEKRLRSFRMKCAETAKVLSWERQAAMAARIVDRIRMGLKVPAPWAERGHVDNGKWSPWSAAFMTVLDLMAHDRQSHVRVHSDFDFTCDVVLLPGGRRVLAMLFTQQKALQELWEKQSWVEPYPYWDNTDPPEGMSYAQWNRRGAEWDRAVWNQDIPSLSGLTAECVPTSLPMPKVVDIMDHQPTLAQRAKAVALDMVDGECTLEHGGQPVNWEVASQWMRTKGVRRIERAVKEARKKLRKRLTVGDLQRRYGPEVVEPKVPDVDLPL